MKRMNRAISSLVLICFLFNTVVSDLAFGLSAASRIDDIMGIEPKDEFRIKFALEQQLTILEEQGKPLNEETFRSILGTQHAAEKTKYGPADIQLFLHEPQMTPHGFCIKAKVRDGYGPRTYYAIFSLKKDDKGKFPVNVFSEREKSAIFATVLPEKVPGHAKAVERYARHEEGIDTVIRYAHEHGLAREPLRDRFDYNKWVIDMLRRLNIKAANPKKLIPIEDREFSLIKVTSELKQLMLNLPKAIVVGADGEEHEVAYIAHSSNNAVYVFVGENDFDVLTNRRRKVTPEELGFARDATCVWLIHELGVMLGRVPHRFIRHGIGEGDQDPVNQIDERFFGLTENPNTKFSELKLDIVNLDMNLATRDYAAGSAHGVVRKLKPRGKMVIDDNIEMTYIDMFYDRELRLNRARFGFKAPKEVTIYRREIYENQEKKDQLDAARARKNASGNVVLSRLSGEGFVITIGKKKIATISVFYEQGARNTQVVIDAPANIPVIPGGITTGSAVNTVRDNSEGRFLPKPAPAAELDPLEVARRQLVDAADAIHLDPVFLNGLEDGSFVGFLNSQLVTVVDIPILMDDGTQRTFKGWRVIDNDSRGAAKGGIRWDMGVSENEVRALGKWMSSKAGVTGIPLGGAKGGIICDPDELPKEGQARDRLMRGYTQKLVPNKQDAVIGPLKDVPAPDMGTGAPEMYSMRDEYHKITNDPLASAVVTGKPEDEGGSRGRRQATGLGIFLTTVNVLNMMGDKLGIGKDIKGKTIAVQAYGNVGSYAARIFQRHGARVVAVAEKEGILYNENGIDFDALDVHMDSRGGKFSNFKGARIISADEFWRLKVDVLVPAFRENEITADRAKEINAKLIVEGANGPTTPDADAILENRGITVVPDILANAGGVVVSYFEWLQDLEEEKWTFAKVYERLEERMRLATENVIETAAKYKISMRKAAGGIALIRMANAEMARNHRLAAYFDKNKTPYDGYSDTLFIPETLEELNGVIGGNRFAELVKYVEREKSSEIDSIIGGVIKKLPGKERGFVLISGPVTSGKLGFAVQVAERLGRSGRHAIRVNLDAMNPSDMGRLLRGEEIEAVDTVDGQRLTRRVSLKPGDILIAEGDHAASDEILNIIPEKNRFSISIDTAPSMKLADNWPLTSSVLCLLRHILTMKETERKSAIDTIRGWPEQRKAQIAEISLDRSKPDATFNSYLAYELPFIKARVEPLIDEAEAVAKAEKDAGTLKIIERLRRTLKDVTPVSDSSIVPDTSIALQTVGGERFYSKLADEKSTLANPDASVFTVLLADEYRKRTDEAARLVIGLKIRGVQVRIFEATNTEQAGNILATQPVDLAVVSLDGDMHYQKLINGHANTKFVLLSRDASKGPHFTTNMHNVVKLVKGAQEASLEYAPSTIARVASDMIDQRQRADAHTVSPQAANRQQPRGIDPRNGHVMPEDIERMAQNNMIDELMVATEMGQGEDVTKAMEGPEFLSVRLQYKRLMKARQAIQNFDLPTLEMAMGMITASEIPSLERKTAIIYRLGPSLNVYGWDNIQELLKRDSMRTLIEERISALKGEAQPHKTAAVAQTRKTVMVVDDNPAALHLHSQVLEKVGYDVITAEDGKEALDLIGQGRNPDLVVSDIQMPRIDGYQLAKSLPGIPVILISASTPDQAKTAPNVRGFLSRGNFDISELQQKVLDVLQENSNAQAAAEQLSAADFNILMTVAPTMSPRWLVEDIMARPAEIKAEVEKAYRLGLKNSPKKLQEFEVRFKQAEVPVPQTNTARPRRADGTFSEKEPGSPEGALTVFGLYPEVFFNENGFTNTDHEKYASQIGRISESTRQRDRKALAEEGYLQPKKPGLYKLTTLGRAKAAVLAAKFNAKKFDRAARTGTGNGAAFRLYDLARSVVSEKERLDSGINVGSQIVAKSKDSRVESIAAKDRQFTDLLIRIQDIETLDRILELFKISAGSNLAGQGYFDHYFLQAFYQKESIAPGQDLLAALRKWRGVPDEPQEKPQAEPQGLRIAEGTEASGEHSEVFYWDNEGKNPRIHRYGDGHPDDLTFGAAERQTKAAKAQWSIQTRRFRADLYEAIIVQFKKLKEPSYTDNPIPANARFVKAVDEDNKKELHRFEKPPFNHTILITYKVPAAKQASERQTIAKTQAAAAEAAAPNAKAKFNPLKPVELKKVWPAFEYNLDQPGGLVSVRPGKLPSRKETRLPDQPDRGEEYGFDLRLGAQADKNGMKALIGLQDRLRSLFPDITKLYLPSAESFHIALAGRYPDKNLGLLPKKLIDDTVADLRERISSGPGKFTITISGLKRTDNGTIVLDLVENPLLGRLRGNVSEAMRSARWDMEKEVRANLTSGGIITLGRIIPDLQGNWVFMSKDELERLDEEVSIIDEELKKAPISIEFDTVSFVHPTREFLSEGWEKEILVPFVKTITEQLETTSAIHTTNGLSRKISAAKRELDKTETERTNAIAEGVRGEELRALDEKVKEAAGILRGLHTELRRAEQALAVEAVPSTVSVMGSPVLPVSVPRPAGLGEFDLARSRAESEAEPVKSSMPPAFEESEELRPAVASETEEPFALEAIMRLVPSDWLDGWLNIVNFADAVKLAGFTEGIVTPGNSAMIFSERAAFGEVKDDGTVEEGIGVLLPSMIRSGVKVAVIATTLKQIALVEELNQDIPEERQIIYAGSVAEARNMVPAARYYYYRVAGEADAGLLGVTSIEIIVKKIIDAIGKVTNIIDAKLIEDMHEAARRFAQAA